MSPNENASAAIEPTGEGAQPAPEISPMAEALTKIPIEAVDEEFLSKCSAAELEEFQTLVYVLALRLKEKAEIAHRIQEFRSECMNKARRLRTLPKAERVAVMGTYTNEEAVQVLKALDELAKGPAEEEKPAAQNLMGSQIKRDVVDEVPPGGSEMTEPA